MARTSRKNNLTETVTSKLSAKYTVGAYIRISKEDNERDSSVSNQESMIRDFLSNRPEMLLFRTYIDNGVSSFKPARKAFDELITDVDAGKVNCVITKDLSRFGRDYIESGDYIENVFPSKGTRFIAIGDNYDSFNIKSSNETLSMAIKSVVNMQYSKDISVKVKSVITTKMKLGNYIPAALPYGYKKQYENKVFTYVVDAETADNVNKIFELACDGAQCFDIASALNEAGILSPSAYKHSKGIQNNPGANGWSKYAVERILKNRAYLGEMICNRTSNSLVSRNVKRLDESNWIVFRDHHEPIIDAETFGKAQEVFVSQRAVSQSSAKPKQNKEYYQRELFCGDCGRKMRNRVWKGKTYFICPRYEEARNLCSIKSLRDDILRARIYESIVEQCSAELRTLSPRNSLEELSPELYERFVEKVKVFDNHVELVYKSNTKEEII